jgi:hypothetical protein
MKEKSKSMGEYAQKCLTLREVLLADPRNVEAWYQLASLVTDPEKVQYCLEQVIKLDPEHTGAREWLQKIHADSATDIPTQTEASEWKDDRCPYIGLMDDPQSLMAYPSEKNYCHRTPHSREVQLEYQKHYCLVEAHNRCVVFLGRDPNAEESSANKPVLNPLLAIKRAHP